MKIHGNNLLSRKFCSYHLSLIILFKEAAVIFKCVFYFIYHFLFSFPVSFLPNVFLYLYYNNDIKIHAPSERNMFSQCLYAIAINIFSP